MTVVVGVDPGARWTGIVTREGGRLRSWTVVEGDGTVSSEYARTVCGTVASYLEGADPGAVVAVEDVVAPCPHVRRRNGSSLTDPGPIIRTGVLLGWVLASLDGTGVPVHVIRPGGHGSSPLRAYPDDLITARERAHAEKTRGWLKPAPQNAAVRHARSAWDVAGAALVLARCLR